MTVLRSIDELADAVRGIETSGRIVVGIAGSPGAGKSTIAAALVARLAGRAALLPMDGFHLPQATLIERGSRDRMGAPDTFDVDGFVATLAALRPAYGNSGETVLAPGFDRDIEEAVPGAIAISPEFPIVVTEGNYLLLRAGGWERVAPLLDASFFVSVDRDIRLARLTARHERFGKSPADAAAWAEGPDERNAVLVEASEHSATHSIALG
ncbi:MAG: nucleoside/nucleotide kinase family protein [Microbacteriaceae bacterium]|nr:nucleoside/nucleotide kinase family protein [Microbacteriaceae bacterium]